MRKRRAIVVGACLVLGLALGLGSFPRPLLGGDQSRAKELIQQACIGCHRFEGQAESRFKLRAPDLIWAGSKYQRPWLIGWLTGKEPPLYAKGYRWDLAEGATGHPIVSESDARALAEYFEQHLVDPRVKLGAFDVSKVSAIEVEFGRQAYKAHACLGCHVIEEKGQIIGGPQSASLVSAGRRYNMDWLFRFGQNPQDFAPHSGEFLADATEPQLRTVIGFLAVQGVKDFTYYEPWTSQEFGRASPERGKVLYKEYCAQCHGLTGKGDGPAASGLSPKPAIHATMPFDKLPMDYLYNVINHGGRALGKSPNMPYWGLTIGQQGVADVIAYLKVTFKGGAPVAQAEPAQDGGPSGVCPQPRQTVKAPAEFLTMTNPLPASPKVLQAGKTLFLENAKPVACAMCHGNQGDGRGFMGAALMPPPRNFTCGKMMKEIPDGQLFWIVKKGSPGTGMMSFDGLPDDDVWQVIRYIRSLAK
jgi:mono/diheme cytochrome c family protein